MGRLLLEGTYTRKCDGVVCLYDAEYQVGPSAVTWDASVYADGALLGTPGGQFAGPVPMAVVEAIVRTMVERSIETGTGTRT